MEPYKWFPIFDTFRFYNEATLNGLGVFFPTTQK